MYHRGDKRIINAFIMIKLLELRVERCPSESTDDAKTASLLTNRLFGCNKEKRPVAYSVSSDRSHMRAERARAFESSKDETSCCGTF